MNITELLEKFTETPGPSGFEDRISALISDTWKPLSDDLFIDRIGNVVATKRGGGAEPRPRLLLAAHLDEIGLMVKQIVDHNGFSFLRLTQVGGVDIRHLYGQTAIVHGHQDLIGVLGSLPVHMLPEDRRLKPFGYEDLVLDLGLPVKEVRELVSIGDFISFRQPLRKMIGSAVTGKALDNRASVAVITVTLNYLKDRKHDWDVIAVGTAQEETRLLGAFTSGFAHKPDAAVAIDVTFGQGAGLADSNYFEIGDGPVLEIGPNIHPGMFNSLEEAAKALEMKVSTSTHAQASGTDAYALQISRAGIPTGLISIPLRYMHTMVETIITEDIDRAGRLLCEFITRLDGEFLGNLAQRMIDED